MKQSKDEYELGLEEIVKNKKEPEEAIKIEPEEAIKILNRYKEILKTQKKRIINIADKQGQLSKRFKESEQLFETVGLSRSTIYFKTILYKFFNNHPVVKKVYPIF